MTANPLRLDKIVQQPEGRLLVFPEIAKKTYKNKKEELYKKTLDGIYSHVRARLPPVWYNRDEIAQVAVAMYVALQPMQNHKFYESMVNGDIGLQATVSYIQENDLLTRIIAENGYDNVMCGDGYAGLVSHAFEKLEGYPKVNEHRDTHNTDALSVIPHFIRDEAFPRFLEEARREYCGSKCKRKMQCAGVTDLHKEQASLYFS